VSSQTAIIIVIRRSSLVRAARAVLEYAITISIAALASYLILGCRW
jgi:hypothetical protein